VINLTTMPTFGVKRCCRTNCERTGSVDYRTVYCQKKKRLRGFDTFDYDKCQQEIVVVTPAILGGMNLYFSAEVD
jgi:hypothetical protein